MNGSKPLLHFGILLCLVGDLLAGYWIITLIGSAKLLGFGLHAICFGGFYLVVKQLPFDKHPPDSNFALVSLVLTAVLPTYGIFGAYVVYSSLQKVEIQPGEYYEVEDEFVAHGHKASLENISENVLEIKREELEVMSFKDIFQSRDRLLEENAINKLSKLVNQQSVSILQEVVKTTSSDTKILAASALIDMEDKITKRVEELQKKLKQEPDNSSYRLELGRAYDLYCHLGVRDTVVKNYYQKLALEQYQYFLRSCPGHPEATFEYGRILLSQGDPDKAIRVFTEAAELAPKDPNPQVWLAEAYYEKEDYAAVHTICERLEQKRTVPKHLKEVVNWWSGSQPSGQETSIHA
ncbi:tetratricopeptide repeat protein [bacterium]|nr:tetratricopeptide repeat protein [bacterium]